jgi:hypothetical protein
VGRLVRARFGSSRWMECCVGVNECLDMVLGLGVGRGKVLATTEKLGWECLVLSRSIMSHAHKSKSSLDFIDSHSTPRIHQINVCSLVSKSTPLLA